MSDERTIEDIASIGSAPLPPGSEEGVDARDGDAFDLLQTEMDKLQREGPAAVDWSLIATRGLDFLAHDSKDILVASWTTHALYRDRGVPGLAGGLGLIRNMMADHWSTLYPPERRARARVMALEWLSERNGPLLSDEKADARRAEAFAYANTALEEIGRLLDRHLADSKVNLLELQRPLRSLAGEAEKLANPPKPAAAEKAEGGKGAAAAQGSTPPASSFALPHNLGEADLEPAFRQVTGATLSLARKLRKAKAWDQRAYALTRAASWIEILELPPVEAGRSAIPDPDKDLKTAIEALLREGEAADALEMAESAFEDWILWFDAQRYVCMALSALGERYLDARSCVTAALAGLLLRLPKLIDMQFAGGRPFADHATKVWIAEQVLPKGEAVAAPGSATAGDDDRIAKAAEAARAHAGEGRLTQGLALFAEGRRQAASQRDRFSWDIAQARFCLDAGAEQVAQPLLACLDQEIADRSLESWDPDLCSQALVLRYRALAAAEAEEEQEADPRRLQHAILKRLARIDMVAAAELAQ